MKKVFSAVLGLTVLAAMLGACAPKAETKKTEAPQQAASGANEAGAKQQEGQLSGSVAMITDTGGINDESFNQSAWLGMEELKVNGVKVSFIESAKAADYVPNLEKKCDEGNDLIWGVGFQMQGDLAKVAKEYSDQAFALVDGQYPEGEAPNVTGAMFHAEQSSFLVGYIAAYVTKTDRVGIVMGDVGPVMDGFRYGYEAGVNYGAKEQGKEVKVDYVNISSFTDTAKGKAAAQKMYADNADIVYQVAGGAGLGVIEAAKDANKWAIGVDLDQYELAPKNILTSALKNVNVAVFKLSSRILKGEKLGGKTVFFGLKDGGVGIAPTSAENVPADVLKKEKAVEQQILSDELVVPATEKEYKAFMAKLG